MSITGVHPGMDWCGQHFSWTSYSSFTSVFQFCSFLYAPALPSTQAYHSLLTSLSLTSKLSPPQTTIYVTGGKHRKILFLGFLFVWVFLLTSPARPSVATWNLSFEIQTACSSSKAVNWKESHLRDALIFPTPHSVSWAHCAITYHLATPFSKPSTSKQVSARLLVPDRLCGHPASPSCSLGDLVHGAQPLWTTLPNKSTHLTGLLWGFNELTPKECLEHHLCPQEAWNKQGLSLLL